MCIIGINYVLSAYLSFGLCARNVNLYRLFVCSESRSKEENEGMIMVGFVRNITLFRIMVLFYCELVCRYICLCTVYVCMLERVGGCVCVCVRERERERERRSMVF